MTEPFRAGFRYGRRSLALDYARSGAGAAVCGALLLVASPALVAGVLIAAAGALFLVYFTRTVRRHLTRIELDEAGIRVRGPWGADIRWENLRTMRLDYYSTRADREEGWMQLRLRDARRTIRLDSDLEGFDELVRAAAEQASRRGLALDASSLGNLQALGS
jgi:hypothetical protein